MSLRSVSCVGIDGVDCRFSLDLRLRLRRLLLFNLRAVILIVFWSKFSGNLTVKGSKFGFELLSKPFLDYSLVSLEVFCQHVVDKRFD